MKMIWVKFQRAGIHYFERAKHEDELKDVSYLGSPHRHLFKFKVMVEVFHDDRDIEFHQLLNFLERNIDLGILKLDNKSCEMISDDMFALVDLYCQRTKNARKRKVVIEVSEDGECGSVATYETSGGISDDFS